MKIELKDMRPDAVSDALIVLPFTEEGIKNVRGSGIYEAARDAVSAGDFRGKFKSSLFLRTDRAKTKRLLLIGLGKEDKLTIERIRDMYSVAVSHADKYKVRSFSVKLPEPKKIRQDEVLKAVIEGVVLTDYKFDKYKKKEKEERPITTLTILSKPSKENLDTVRETQIICENTKMARDLINEPADVMNTVSLGNFARDVARKHGMKFTLISNEELEKQGLNLIFSVGKGSKYPPCLAIMEYWGGRKGEKPIALVGKGITFDTGGINLKPTGYIETMKCDKSGAIAVMCTMKALAELKVRKNVIGVAPLCENMIGSHAQRPSDIIKSYSGKTVEIQNTDAEGRLILADALAYTEKKYKPGVIVDLATLTGAVVVCLGDVAAGMISNDDRFAKKMHEAGERTFERVWRLPLYEEFEEMMKGEVSDLKNLGFKGHAGTITGAAFLKQFVDKTPWVHLDIAGTAWIEKPKYYVPKFGTGWGIRILMEFIRSI